MLNILNISLETTDIILFFSNNNIYLYLMSLKLNIYYMLFKVFMDIELYRKVKIQQYIGNFVWPFITNFYFFFIYKNLVKIGVIYKKYRKIIRYGYLKVDKRKEYYYRFFEIGSFRIFFLSFGLILYIYIWKHRSMYRIDSIIMILVAYYFMTLFAIYILSCFSTSTNIIILFAILFAFSYILLFKIN